MINDVIFFGALISLLLLLYARLVRHSRLSDIPLRSSDRHQILRRSKRW
ncbi:MAG: hypothetical protein JW726_13870 [Anaerolineales bacterium]|nr:hypothetical protein [Anaerolineales bacterium]